MALSAPAPRRLTHTRSVQVCGFARDDGLWDIEAELTDTKPYPIASADRGGEIGAGEPIHGMRLRLTLDRDLLIHAAEAHTHYAPFRECPSVSRRYQQLVGLRIGPGWNRRVKELFGDTAGCTHLTELLGPLATTAFQTINGPHPGDLGHQPPQPPPVLDGCHALAADGAVVARYWPRYARRSDTDAA